MESMVNFANRVLDRTGIAIDEIPDGVPDDILGGHIMCRRGHLYVVGVGYPDENDGAEVYREVRVVRL